MRRISAAILAVGLSLGIANAADMPVKAPTYKAALAYDPWSGFYLGASVGGRWSVTDWKTDDFGTLFGVPGPGRPAGSIDNPANLDSASMRVGGYIGYNWKLAPAWVTGLEVDVAWANSTKSHSPFPGAAIFGAAFGAPNGDFVTAKLGWDGSIRGRLGYLLTPTWLLYATGGGAWQQITTSASCDGGPTSYCLAAFSESSSTTKFGWTIGGGVETVLAPHWLARVEYRYADFGSVSNNLPPAPGFGFNATVRVRTNTALAGIAYKF